MNINPSNLNARGNIRQVVPPQESRWDKVLTGIKTIGRPIGAVAGGLSGAVAGGLSGGYTGAAIGGLQGLRTGWQYGRMASLVADEVQKTKNEIQRGNPDPYNKYDDYVDYSYGYKPKPDWTSYPQYDKPYNNSGYYGYYRDNGSYTNYNTYYPAYSYQPVSYNGYNYNPYYINYPRYYYNGYY